jgi:hypothetical protein
MAVVSIAVVSNSVVSIAAISIAVVSIAVVSIAEPHHVSVPISSCHAAPVRHVKRLQSGIPVVSIAIVSIAEVSIAEPHHVMRLHCWVGLKQKFSFSYFREKFLIASRTQIYENKNFHKKETFVKTFAKVKIFAKSEND